MLETAGFDDVEMVSSTGYRTAPTTIGATFPGEKAEVVPV
jgi:hypothetical protein